MRLSEQWLEMPSAIRARQLTKRYPYTEQIPGILGGLRGLLRPRRRERLAVDELDLDVQSGQIIGLLGPNGAGKTTAIKMMCGLLRPTSGELRVLGHEPARRQFGFLRQISVVFGQKNMLWWDVSPHESLLVHRRMYDMSSRDFERSVHDLTDRLQVRDILHVPVRKLSLGQRMRCELMLALLHGPRLLFADEPTVGLDIVAKLNVRAFLGEINRDLGTTIVLSSHDMSDVAALCQRVVIINRGMVEFDGDLSSLRARFKPTKHVAVMYRDPVALACTARPGLTFLESEDPRIVKLEVTRDDLPWLLREASGWGDVVDVDVLDGDLDQVLAGVYGARSDVLGA